jgi:predicted acyl esterase
MSRGDPWGIRTTHPSAWPQVPYDTLPGGEASPPRYELLADLDCELALPDGVTLLFDLYRPVRPGVRFPALVAVSPYSRHLQRTPVAWGPNEAGISEFWVSRGYAHVVVDVRGTNGSGGDWDMLGPLEQADYVEIVEWVARQPWCDGRVGMAGCSYFAMAQNLAAAASPPSLRAVFPYDAMTDMYRWRFFPGGIPNDFGNVWFNQIAALNGASGRNPDASAIAHHAREVLTLARPLDGDYYRERSAWPVLDRVTVPSYYGSDWRFYQGHLAGVFDAWRRSGASVKRALVGPRPRPFRPFAAYHVEALRWYDAFLRDLDTGVLEGSPIRLWIEGDDCWRGEEEWPLARTRFEEWHLGPGTLGADVPAAGEAVLKVDPAKDSWLLGEPRLVFRSEPAEAPLELTGPFELVLAFASTAEDADWIVTLHDESPDGGRVELTKGRLRSSHRAVDPGQSAPGEPWHSHTEALPLQPGREETLRIGLVATSVVLAHGHRLRLELANSESTALLIERAKTLRLPATNTVLTGAGRSRLIVPVIPR